MPRPKKCRRVCTEPEFVRFTPAGRGRRERVVMNVDEYEIIRLIDYDKMTQEECALQMGIARTSVTDMYDKARYKIADCIIHGKVLEISGGNYLVCNGRAEGCAGSCPVCTGAAGRKPADGIAEKGADEMRVAVTYENGEIFQHFGHTEQFKIYDIEDGAIKKEQIVGTDGQGHGALADVLNGLDADVLICGGIGGGAGMALADAGIKLYGGVQGNADEAVKAFIAGNLSYDPDVHCDHHDAEGSGNHKCGNNGCGGHGAMRQDK